MSVATTTAIAIGAGVSAAGAIGGAVLSSNASKDAASTQADAAKSAAQLQADQAQKALDFQKQEWTQQQANEAPFLKAGQGAVNNLASLANDPNFSKYPGGPFQAPTLAEAQQTPGYQFQLEQGTQAINQNAAANGSLLTGNTGTALQKYGQGLADSTYNQDYQRALNTYMTNYGVWNADTANQFNRLGDLAGIGTSAAANLGAQGTAAANTAANINLTAGAQQGQDLNNIGAAQASGIVGSANALTSGLNSLGSIGSSLPFYSMLAQQQNQSSYTAPYVGSTMQPSYMPGGGTTPPPYDPFNLPTA